MSEQAKDFEKLLADKTAELTDCQKQQSVDSCFKCEKVLGCELRNEYVKAVYFSMSKGETGDFEF